MSPKLKQYNAGALRTRKVLLANNPEKSENPGLNCHIGIYSDDTFLQRFVMEMFHMEMFLYRVVKIKNKKLLKIII